MKRWVVVCLLAVVAIGGEAIAQVDPDPDGIGIYADQTAEVTTIRAEPGTPFEAYLVLTRPSSPGAILGWECRLVVPDNVTIWGWNIAGGPWFNFGNPPEFVVCYVNGLPLADTVLLMTFIIFVNDAEPAQFYITHNYINSGGYDLPVYVDASNINLIRPLHPYPDGPTAPSFVINQDLVPVASESWGAVKNLYQ